MKLDVTLQVGSESRNRQIDLILVASGRAASGRLQFVVDGEKGEADWVEIADGVYSILVGAQSFEVHVAASADNKGARPRSYDVTWGEQRYHLEVRDPRRRRHFAREAGFEGPHEILAPMPGRIVKILVAENQEVGQGEGLLVIEAMKMQNELRAPRAGRVEKLHVKEDAGVEMGVKLLRLT